MSSVENFLSGHSEHNINANIQHTAFSKYLFDFTISKISIYLLSYDLLVCCGNTTNQVVVITEWVIWTLFLVYYLLIRHSY